MSDFDALDAVCWIIAMIMVWGFIQAKFTEALLLSAVVFGLFVFLVYSHGGSITYSGF